MLKNLILEHADISKNAEVQRIISKWEPTGLLDNLNESKKVTIACLLENEAGILKSSLLTETTATGTSAGFEAWSNVALPLVRRVFANLISNDLVSVQPMTLPSGLVFYLDFKWGTGKPIGSGAVADPHLFINDRSVYGTTTGSASGNEMEGYYGGLNFSYTQNYATGSSVTASLTCSANAGSGDAAAFSFSLSDVEFDTQMSASFAAGNIKRIAIGSGALGQLDITAVKAISVNDTGISKIYRRFTTYDEPTGRVYMVISGSTTGTGITTVSYIRKTTQDWRGDFEFGKGSPTASDEIPEINMDIKSKPVVAQTRKLKAVWTPEMQQDIAAYHNIDVEAELTGILSELTGLEIDREIIADLMDAAAVRSYWSRNIGTFVRPDGTTVTGTGVFYGTQQDWYQTLVETILEVSNQIHKRTLRGSANWIVTSPEISSMLEAMNTFRSDRVTEGTDTSYNLGIEKMGVLNNRWSVYKDPLFPTNKILLGLKGKSFLESGYVYAPYVPFVLTPTILDPTYFVPRKAIMTRYGKVRIRNDFYGVITVRDMRY